MKTLTSVVKELGEQSEESVTETGGEDRRRRRSSAGSFCSPRPPSPFISWEESRQPAVTALCLLDAGSVQQMGSTDWKRERE